MSLDLCLKQLHVVHIKVFHRKAYVCSCSTPSFSSPANSTPSFLMVRHFSVLQIPVTRTDRRTDTWWQLTPR